MPLDTQVVVYLPSIDNTEERFTGRSYTIFGCSVVIKELHHRTQCWRRLPKWHTFTFAINCRSSVTTSSRMHDHSSRRTPQGCTAVYLVRMAFASRQEYLYLFLGIRQDSQQDEKVGVFSNQYICSTTISNVQCRQNNQLIDQHPRTHGAPHNQ